MPVIQLGAQGDEVICLTCSKAAFRLYSLRTCIKAAGLGCTFGQNLGGLCPRGQHGPCLSHVSLDSRWLHRCQSTCSPAELLPLWTVTTLSPSTSRPGLPKPPVTVTSCRGPASCPTVSLAPPAPLVPPPPSHADAAPPNADPSLSAHSPTSASSLRTLNMALLWG